MGKQLFIAATALLLLPAVMAAPQAAGEPPQSATAAETDAMLLDVLARIRQDYAGEVSEAELRQAALRAMLDKLDPQSQLLSPDRFKTVMNAVESRDQGLGLDLERRAKSYVVIAPIDGTPAAEAGVEPGDHLLAIDGVAVDDMSHEQVLEGLRGTPGDRVKLLMQRGFSAPVLLELEHASYRKLPVTGTDMGDGYHYLRLAFFSTDLLRHLRDHFQRIEASDPAPKGLVIDLRNNPGGIIDAAIESADLLLGEGVITRTISRKQDFDRTVMATPGAQLAGVPIIVLINRGTASAAELFAAALQGNRRAVLQGTATFGKGSMQEIVPLASGEALRLTIAYYATPAGIPIDGQGLAPDLLVHDRGATRDLQATAMSRSILPGLISGQEWAFKGRATMVENPAPPLTPETDPAVQQAINTLKGRRLLSGFELAPE
ncbi:MAG: S41 family peptidase [Gammaproteobacteria bacterium]|nr:S41 family peptidase [Gammaproteobacteria bacterium]